MKATSTFLPSASSPPPVEEPSASSAPLATFSPGVTRGFWWMRVPWFERMNFSSGYSSLPEPVSITTRVAST